MTKAEIKGLNKAISNYNSTVSKSGKAKDGTLTIVKFELSAEGYSSDEAVMTAAGEDTFTDSDGEVRGFGNVVEGHNSSGSEMGDADGFKIRLNRTNISDAADKGFSQDDILESTFNHEIGHNLGGRHGDASPMAETMTLFYKQNSDQIGGAGVPTVPRANVTKKFVNTITDRIGTPHPTNSGHIMWEKGKSRR